MIHCGWIVLHEKHTATETFFNSTLLAGLGRTLLISKKTLQSAHIIIADFPHKSCQ